jgi:hypothetical protein
LCARQTIASTTDHEVRFLYALFGHFMTNEQEPILGVDI